MGRQILDRVHRGIQHMALGHQESSVGEEFRGACLEVLQYILDRRMALLFGERLSSSTGCTTSGGMHVECLGRVRTPA